MLVMPKQHFGLTVGNAKYSFKLLKIICHKADALSMLKSPLWAIYFGFSQSKDVCRAHAPTNEMHTLCCCLDKKKHFWLEM